MSYLLYCFAFQGLTILGATVNIPSSIHDTFQDRNTLINFVSNIAIKTEILPDKKTQKDKYSNFINKMVVR